MAIHLKKKKIIIMLTPLYQQYFKVKGKIKVTLPIRA